jgi:cyanophycinase-like exopeptidase
MFEKIVRISENGTILVVPWTSNSMTKETEYRALLGKYFIDVGFEDVVFLERNDSESEISSKFARAGALYLPGGDPVILKEEMQLKGIHEKIRDYSGIVIGNSAGAIVLSNGAYVAGKFLKGFGFVEKTIKVHFELERQDRVPNVEGPVVGIPENMWISISTSLQTEVGERKA